MIVRTAYEEAKRLLQRGRPDLAFATPGPDALAKALAYLRGGQRHSRSGHNHTGCLAGPRSLSPGRFRRSRYHTARRGGDGGTMKGATMYMYMYQADLYCDSCGKNLCLQVTPPADYPPPWDTDDYPRRVGSESTDNPLHCGAGAECLEAEVLPNGARIGKLLGTDLTEAGIEYVQAAIREGGPVAEFWREAFFDEIDW